MTRHPPSSYHTIHLLLAIIDQTNCIISRAPPYRSKRNHPPPPLILNPLCIAFHRPVPSCTLSRTLSQTSYASCSFCISVRSLFTIANCSLGPPARSKLVESEVGSRCPWPAATLFICSCNCSSCQCYHCCAHKKFVNFELRDLGFVG